LLAFEPFKPIDNFSSTASNYTPLPFHFYGIKTNRGKTIVLEKFFYFFKEKQKKGFTDRIFVSLFISF